MQLYSVHTLTNSLTLSLSPPPSLSLFLLGLSSYLQQLHIVQVADAKVLEIPNDRTDTYLNAIMQAADRISPPASGHHFSNQQRWSLLCSQETLLH